MTNESCIHCGTQVDFSSGSNCELGPIHFACREAFHNGRVPEPETPHDPEAPDSSSTDAQTDAKDYPLSARILGGFLRFFGMFLIVGAAIFWLIGAGIGHPLPSLPVMMALVGAGMHFAGRKITPGKAGASAGGAVGGAVLGGVVAAVVAAIVATGPVAIIVLLIFLITQYG